MTYQKSIVKHYENMWEQTANFYLWDKGANEKMSFDFRVLEFAPNPKRDMWIYATCCMSQNNNTNPIELHMFSSQRDESIVELLTSVSYYHKNTEKLNLWHTVNFGRPWQNQSICEYGIISLPYLDGPNLENLQYNDICPVKCYWLIPITKLEVEYKKRYGVEALETKFEEMGLDYINPNRASVV